jgi:alkylated DNA repair dioxygenase AlkB
VGIACVRAETAIFQGSLFGQGPVEVRKEAPFERIDLGLGAWIDVSRAWLAGADAALGSLISEVDWRQHRRRMYERVVDEPRLSRWYRAGEVMPHRVLTLFREAASERYGVSFGAVALNYYRDGRDSVAFHADRELRDLDDALVAILTFGAERPFLVRPAGGGRSIDLRPRSGDLLVMGGTCQAGWEHAVPKVAGGCGPRVSASVRWSRAAGAEREWAPPGRLALGSARRADPRFRREIP